MKVKVEYDLESDGETLTMEEAGLKDIIEIPDTIEEDEVTDWISDKTGWCIFGWVEL